MPEIFIRAKEKILYLDMNKNERGAQLPLDKLIIRIIHVFRCMDE